jgi:hypothetical protein
VNDEPVDKLTHHDPFEESKVAVSERPSLLKSPTRKDPTAPTGPEVEKGYKAAAPVRSWCVRSRSPVFVPLHWG